MFIRKIALLIVLFAIPLFQVMAQSNPFNLKENLERTNPQNQLKPEPKPPRDIRQQDSQADQTPAQTFLLSGVTITGATLLTGEEVKPFALKYVGQQVTPEQFYTFIEELNGLLLTKGHLSARVILPSQDVQNGNIQLHVVNTKLKEIEVRQNRHYDADVFRVPYEHLIGKPLNRDALLDATRSLDNLPAVGVRFLVDVKDLESSHLVVFVQELERSKSLLTLDNSGSESTGKDMLRYTFQYDNPTGSGDSLTLSAGGSLQGGVYYLSASYSDRIGYHGASYQITAMGLGLNYTHRGRQKLGSDNTLLGQEETFIDGDRVLIPNYLRKQNYVRGTLEEYQLQFNYPIFNASDDKYTLFTTLNIINSYTKSKGVVLRDFRFTKNTDVLVCDSDSITPVTSDEDGEIIGTFCSTYIETTQSQEIDFSELEHTEVEFRDRVRSITLGVNYKPSLKRDTMVLSLQYEQGLDGLGAMSDEHVDESRSARANAYAQFKLWQFSYAQLIDLPKDMLLSLNFYGQVALTRLVSGKLFYAGGSGSVRGYASSEISGDSGYVANLELVKKFLPRLAGTAFVDYGHAERKEYVTANDQHVKKEENMLYSAGLGASYHFEPYSIFANPNLSVQFAKALGRNPDTNLLDNPDVDSGVYYIRISSLIQ